MTWKKWTAIAIAVIALPLGASGGVQAANLVTNGGFETTTTGAGQLGFNTDATGWSSAGNGGSYNFLFTPGSADTTGVNGQDGTLLLWGPNNGSANGLPATSPAGGNYVGMDGAFQSGPISQTINGLTVGDTYAVSFYWAGAQQSGFDGANTEQFQVSLGAQTQSTAVYDNASHGFSGWMSQTFDFTATSTSELLSFLAIGTPISPSVPPFSLLDGVSLNAVSSVPEPGSLSLMAIGILGLAGVSLRRRAKSVAV